MGAADYGVHMRKKLRDDESVFRHLRRFLILLTGDLAVAAVILQEAQLTPVIGPSLGKHDRAFQMKLYKVAYQKIMKACEQAASKSEPISKLDSGDVCLLSLIHI